MDVLYFSADWCGPCKMFKPIVQQVSQETGVDINYVNVDYDASLSQRYDIKSIPTIVILDAAGNVQWRHTGVLQREQLKSALQTFK
jgi:thioredoxin 1